MSKERLEEIQKEVNYAYRRDGSISTKAVTMPIEHYEHIYEQAERVKEYEYRYNKHLDLDIKNHDKIRQLEQQNKRYREAIEVATNNMKDSDHLGVKFALGVLEQVLEGEE